MNQREEEIFRYAMKVYKDQWDRNQYNRDNYDEDIEYYLGYRNASKYPLAYNETFNRILPLIYTILSRFMDQLYQAGNIVSVKPRKSRDIENAKKVESVLNFQLENMNSIDDGGGSYNIMLKWFFNMLNFGKGIMKAYWRKEDRISPRRIVQPMPKFDRFGNFQGYDLEDYITMENQSVYDQPYLEVLHNKICVPHPEYKSIQQMPAFFCVYKRSVDYAKKMFDQGEWKNIDELYPQGGNASYQTKDSKETFIKSLELERGLQLDESDDDRKPKDIDIIEGYMKLIVDDEPYEVGSGIKIKGREQESIVHIGNYNTILSIQRNPYHIRPFFDINCYMQPEMFWDIGIIRLAKGIQEQINNLSNLRMQDSMMRMSQMIRVDPESEVDPADLVWRPFGVIPANDGEIEPIIIPDYNSGMFQEQERFLENTVQDLAGIYDYNKGVTPQRQERVGVVHSIQSMGEARSRLMLMSADHQGMRPLLKYMMTLNTFHLPSGFEYRVGDGQQEQQGQGFGQIFGDDIHSDFDFAARYTAMEPALGKQFRVQNLLQLAPMVQQNPWINQHQWMKTIFELADIREADYLLKTPQQFSQEMQQQQKQQQDMMKMQVMVEKMKKQDEVKGNLVESQKDFIEDTALNEQSFRHDLVLKAIENDASKEAA